MKFRVLGMCNEARRGQDSEGGCEVGYEGRKQSKVDERPDNKLEDILMDMFGHKSPEWIINEQGEACVERYCMEES